MYKLITTFYLITLKGANHFYRWFMGKLCLKCQHDNSYDRLVTQFHAKPFCWIEFMTDSLSDKHSLNGHLWLCPNLHSFSIDKCLNCSDWNYISFLTWKKPSKIEINLLLFWRRIDTIKNRIRYESKCHFYLQ